MSWRVLTLVLVSRIHLLRTGAAAAIYSLLLLKGWCTAPDIVQARVLFYRSQEVSKIVEEHRKAHPRNNDAPVLGPDECRAISALVPFGPRELLHRNYQDIFNFWEIKPPEGSGWNDVAVGLEFDFTSEDAGTLIVALSWSGPGYVFINDEPVLGCLAEREMRRSSSLLRIPVRSGANTLRLVVRGHPERRSRPRNDADPEWVAAVKLLSNETDAIQYQRRHCWYPLLRPLVAEWSDFQTASNIEAYKKVLVYDSQRALRAQGHVNSNGDIIWDMPPPAPPFFGLLTFGDLIGEPIIVARDLKQVQEMVSAAHFNDATNPWQFRLSHLLRNQPKSGSDVWWMRKASNALFMGAYLKDSYSSHDLIKSEQFAWLRQRSPSAAVLNFMYKTESGEARVLRFFVPTRISEKSRCLYIVPTAPNPVRPFLESTSMADLQAVHDFSSIADEFDFALVWPGYVDVDYGGRRSVSELIEALNASSMIDGLPTGKVAMGFCSAGVTALNLLRKAPNSVTGVLLYSPFFMRQTKVWLPEIEFDEIDSGEDSSMDDWNPWIHRDQLHGKVIPLFFDSGMLGHGDPFLTPSFSADQEKYGYTAPIVNGEPVRFLEWGERAKAKLRMVFALELSTRAVAVAPRKGGSNLLSGFSIKAALLSGFRIAQPAGPMSRRWLEKWESISKQYGGSVMGSELKDGSSATHTIVDLSDVLDGDQLSAEARSKVAGVSSFRAQRIERGGETTIKVSMSIGEGDSPPAVDLLVDGEFEEIIMVCETGKWHTVFCKK